MPVYCHGLAVICSIHLGQKWGADTQAFFFSTYLQNGEGLALGFVPTLFFGLVTVWAVVMFILYGGVRRGVELANKIFMPLLADFIYHFSDSSCTFAWCNRGFKCFLYAKSGCNDQLEKFG